MLSADRLSQPIRLPSWTTNNAVAASSTTPPSRRKNTNGSIAESENSATTAATLSNGMPSLAPPVACLSHKNCNGTSKLSSYPAHPRKQEIIASTPPMSAIGDGSSRRDLAIPRRAFQTAGATATPRDRRTSPPLFRLTASRRRLVGASVRECPPSSRQSRLQHRCYR